MLKTEIKKLRIKKGDEVQVLLGKDRGKSGKVMRVFSKGNKVLVEGLNMYKRHVRKMGEHEGGIIEIPKPLNISNVAFVCPKCKKPTRIGYRIDGENKVRICKKCGEVINDKIKG